MHVARLDTHQVGVLGILRTKRGEDRGRRGEELRLEPESLRDLAHHVLEPMSGIAVGVQRSTQAQHEPDAGIARAGFGHRFRIDAPCGRLVAHHQRERTT